MSEPVILDARLCAVGNMVRKGVKIADVGTDHGYLIGNLTYSGKIAGGIACDINQMPLDNARKYIRMLGVENKVSCIISNGLKNVSGTIVEDVVVAGMGGELISEIILNCPWLRDAKKSIVLQPMTKSEVVREKLYKEGFELIEERAVLCEDKLYTVMRWIYAGVPMTIGPCFAFTGKLAESPNEHTNLYFDKVIRYILNRAFGIKELDEALSKKYFDLAIEIANMKL